MTKKPIFTFENKLAKGLDKVPLTSIVFVEDKDDTGTSILFTLLNKTNVSADTTIETFLLLTTQYNIIGEYILDFDNLTDMTGDIAVSTQLILQNGSEESRKAAGEIKLSNFNNDLNWSNTTGTVTSVGTAGTVNGLTLTGTVTSSGTLTLGGTLSISDSDFSGSETAKTFLAAPNASAGTPSFRTIIASDIPTLNQSTTGNADTATTWETARTLTIGNTGKSVNGSAAVTWSLAEIGAQAAGTYDNYVSWTIKDGDTTSYTITSGDTLQIASGSGITSNFSADDVLTISHNDTSSQASVDNAARTYIQDITLDEFGHITALTSGSETVTNTTYLGGTNLTLSGNTFNVDDAFLKNNADDTTSGTITAAGVITIGNMVVGGNLTVNGTTTTINTSELLVEDHNIVLGNVTTPTDITADGGGITLLGDTNKTIVWSNATDSWDFNQPIVASQFTGAVVGDVTGNADTATKWATTRTINITGDVSSDAVNIDGSGNITITNSVVANDSHTHSNYILNNASDSTTGTLTAANLISNGTIGIGTTPNNSLAGFASIALGDGDTGFRQNGDGILEAWANNQEIWEANTTAFTSHKNFIGSGTITSTGDMIINGGNLTINNNNGGIGFNDVSSYWLKTATNWGMYWNTPDNALEFHAAGVVNQVIDLDANSITAGDLNAEVAVNLGSTQEASIQYNSTDNSIDFIIN